MCYALAGLAGGGEGGRCGGGSGIAADGGPETGP